MRLEGPDGETETVTYDVLVGADGVNSKVCVCASERVCVCVRV